MSLAITNTVLDGQVVGLRADDGRITELGPHVAPRPGDEVVEGRDTALVPGLVNGHTHAAMTLFRGYGDDLPLMEWLEQRIWPAEARLDADDVYWGTRLACIEMIRTGTVRFWDMYWQPSAIARAVEDAGLRATIGAPLIDALDPANAPKLREQALESLEDIRGHGARVDASLTPHAIYTVSEPSLRWLGEHAAAADLPVHIHLSETEEEVQQCVDANGARPAAYLDRLGLLGPRTLLAHGVWLDDDELALVGERGATVVTNPVSNLKLAVGAVFRYGAARERGIPVGLGTDGAGSNNALDLLQDVKVFALLQKHEARDPAAVPAAEAWAVVTGQRAPLLGQSGTLAVGEPADFVLVRTDIPELSLGDFTADLVYAASGAAVDTTVVDGVVLMRGGVVDGEAEVRARAVERAQRLGVA
ncbi:MAG: amidohydrolase family protein [Actinomycetota bacterium]